MWFTDYFKPTVATYCSEKNISFQVLQPIGSVFGCSRAQMEMFSEIVAFIPAVCSVVSNSLQPHWLQPTRLLVHGDSQGKNIGVGYHALLQGIFPTQGSNTGLLYWRWILYCLSYQGSLRILEYNILLQGIVPIHESERRDGAAVGGRSKREEICVYIKLIQISQVALGVKNRPANAGDTRDAGSIPGSERCPGGEHDNPLQYSFLENPKDRGAWQATVHDLVAQLCLTLVTPWGVAHQAPLSLGFSRQEYWSGLPVPSLIGLQRVRHNWSDLACTHNWFT